MSRARGHVVVHRLSREVDRPDGNGPGRPYTFVRCVCGYAARADTIEEARALYGGHLDRVEAEGKRVDRDAPAVHAPGIAP